MSQIVDQLTSEDFGKTFDAALFSEWKKSVAAHEKASVINIVLFLAGMAALVFIGALVGLGLFFILAFAGLGISLPKWKKRRDCQLALGVSNSDIRQAVTKCRARTK
ncbi:MAG: hypothetical protein FWD64_08975 [Acidobacteriaceae bacterium]|nr:hypothetical protein [Acidobacteriaceae bacterium]